MADNTTLNAGSGGDTIASDDIGGVKHQRVKLSLGADGSATDALGGAGSVAAGVQRVTLASDDPAVTDLAALEVLAGTIDADTSGMATSLAILDDWDESDRAKVNPIVGQAGVAGGSGTVDATTQRVVLATDVPLPAGTNAIGKLAANSGVDIGDVDVLTLPNVTLAAGTNTNEVVGDAAHGAAVAGNPVLVGLEGRSTAPTAVDDGDVVRALASLLGRLVTLPYALPGSTWSYATANGGVTDTADDEARAAVASTRHYVTSVQVINAHDSTGTEVVIKDGSTVLWRGWAEQTGGGVSAKFDPPLRGTANTAINVANITNASKTYFNLQGFSATE